VRGWGGMGRGREGAWLRGCDGVEGKGGWVFRGHGEIKRRKQEKKKIKIVYRMVWWDNNVGGNEGRWTARGRTYLKNSISGRVMEMVGRSGVYD